jgi:ferric-dicitrate binding protein FerR (iron transport regulator)
MSPHSKGPRALTLYRATPAPRPAASADLRILAAARAAAARSSERRQLLFVGAMAATVMVAFTTRWLVTDPAPHSQDFGIAEGQTHDYLLEFDPLVTGPGSQEGLP